MLREAHNAMENSASGIVIADREGRILRGNPAFLTMWGYSNRRAVEGRNVRELWGDVQAPEDLFLLPLSGKTWMGEQEARTRKGRTIFVQVSAAPNRDSDEKLAGVVFSFVDVTARRKAEDALRREAEAQKTKARASNEFSGLLTALTLPDLVQLIASAKKTGTLVVLGEKENPMATVGFVKGELRSAACSERTGEEAFFELLRLGGEGFRFEARPPAESEQTIQRSTLGLLLEGTQRLDESFLSDTAPQGALDAEKIEVSQGIASSGK
ncbi:MAG: PAS domain S-box protein, partial [Kiritimatiellia bacterium]|nr:PAS domain S-box protein [Kiritimatiellia bacterium]